MLRCSHLPERPQSTDEIGHISTPCTFMPPIHRNKTMRLYYRFIVMRCLPYHYTEPWVRCRASQRMAAVLTCSFTECRLATSEAQKKRRCYTYLPPNALTCHICTDGQASPESAMPRTWMVVGDQARENLASILSSISQYLRHDRVYKISFALNIALFLLSRVSWSKMIQKRHFGKGDLQESAE